MAKDATKLTFAGALGVTFSEANGSFNTTFKGTLTVKGDFASWFTNPFIDKITLATGADFTGAKSIVVTDTQSDTSSSAADEDANAKTLTVDGVTYTVENGTNALTISRTELSRTDMTKELNEAISTSSAAQDKAKNFSGATATAAESVAAAAVGSDSTSLNAGNTVLYMNGLASEIGGLQNGKRLYGGGCNAITQGNVTLDGTLLISGTNIALDYIYGGGFLTSSFDSPAVTSEFNSWVKIEENASFDPDRTISLLGGSHVNQYTYSEDGSLLTSETTIKANSELIVDASVTNANFVCGGHGCYTTTTIIGDSSLTISAGTYGGENDEIVMVAGGSVLYINTTVPAAKLTQTGNTALTITGGSFNSNVYGGNIFLYENEEALKNNNGAGTVNLIGTSSVTIDCTIGKAITFNKNIFAGSNGENDVTATKVTFIGNGSTKQVDNLNIAGYVSGDSSGRYGNMEAEGEYKQYAGEDSREIIFQNFHGTLGGATALYDFDEFTFENSVVDLGSAALNSAGETWNFAKGSSVTWDAGLNFSGDTMILGKQGNSVTTAAPWTVFSGLNSVENFAEMFSVQIFGTTAEWDGTNNCWTAGSYKLAMEDKVADDGVTSYDLVVSIA